MALDTNSGMAPHQHAIARIDAAHEAVRALPEDSPIRAVLTDPYIHERREWVQSIDDLDDALWPPLLMYAMMPWHSRQQLAQLDADLRAIRDHPTSNSAASVRWLSAGPAETRLWRGGFFETCVRAKALAAAASNDKWSVAFDVELPNGRNVDIVLTTPDRSYFLESTVMTESDEDQAVHGRWMDARKDDPGLLLSRPGQFDEPGSKGPSPYYDANRIYIKVFDKLQKDGDRSKTQTSDDSPNVLLLSCFPIFGSPLPFSPAVAWAFDELFSGQPNMGSIKVMPKDSALQDISLSTFLRDTFPAREHDLISCPSRLSGVLLFNCVGLQRGRINYNANTSHEISHLEMAGLEAVFLPPRGWENLHPLAPAENRPLRSPLALGRRAVHWVRGRFASRTTRT